MHRLIFLLLLLSPLLTSAQPDYRKIADSLKYVVDMPYICESELPYGNGCGSKVFWRAVQQKKAIIPFLIDKLTDTTSTQAFVPNFGGNYSVADVAFFALHEIINGIPIFELLGVNFDHDGCGFCAYWNHLRSDLNNRKKFKKAVHRWYDQHKSKLVWVPNGQPFTGHHNGGMYYIKN